MTAEPDLAGSEADFSLAASAAPFLALLTESFFLLGILPKLEHFFKGLLLFEIYFENKIVVFFTLLNFYRKIKQQKPIWVFVA